MPLLRYGVGMPPVRKGSPRGRNATVWPPDGQFSAAFRPPVSACMEPRVPDLTDPGTESPTNGHAPIEDLFAPPPEPGPTPEVRKRKPKLKKLRFFLVFAGLGALALISTIFGMMLSVSSDLP